MSLTKAQKFVADWRRADQGAGASKEVTRELVDAIEELSDWVTQADIAMGKLADCISTAMDAAKEKKS